MDPTDRVPLGRSPLTVTRLGLGLAPLGGLYTPVGDAQAAATVDRAWGHGLRLFDTAPLYGYGRSERRTGAALAARPRAELVLSTKVGRLLDPGEYPDPVWPEATPGVVPQFDFSAPAVLRSLRESLDRLGLDRVDLLHLHDPDDHFGPALAQAYPALARLRAAGTVGAVGAGMNQAPMLARFIRELPPPGLDCVLLAGRYTLLDQSGLDDLLPLCVEHGVAVIIGGVFNSGLLAEPVTGATYNYAPASQPLLDKALALQRVCGRYGVPLRAAAVQFPFAHPAVATVLVGARSPAEVDDAVAMVGHEIPDGLWTALKDEGLVAAAAPTPRGAYR
jgi:D-threo-aldose 1-dehydrogenase